MKKLYNLSDSYLDNNDSYKSMANDFEYITNEVLDFGITCNNPKHRTSVVNIIYSLIDYVKSKINHLNNTFKVITSSSYHKLLYNNYTFEQCLFDKDFKTEVIVMYFTIRECLILNSYMNHKRITSYIDILQLNKDNDIINFIEVISDKAVDFLPYYNHRISEYVHTLINNSKYYRDSSIPVKEEIFDNLVKFIRIINKSDISKILMNGYVPPIFGNDFTNNLKYMYSESIDKYIEVIDTYENLCTIYNDHISTRYFSTMSSSLIAGSPESIRADLILLYTKI